MDPQCCMSHLIEEILETVVSLFFNKTLQIEQHHLQE